MIAVALIALPIALYIWLLCRAADDERTGWDHPTFAPPHCQRPYNWGIDDTTYRWLLARDGWRATLEEIDALPTTEERVG